MAVASAGPYANSLLHLAADTSTTLLNFLQEGCSYWRPVNSVEALKASVYMYTHTHPFNGPFGTTRMSRYRKGKTNLEWILLKQDTVSGSGISWATCKSAPCFNTIQYKICTAPCCHGFRRTGEQES